MKKKIVASYRAKQTHMSFMSNNLGKSFIKQLFDMYSKSVRTAVVRRGVDSLLNPERGGGWQ